MDITESAAILTPESARPDPRRWLGLAVMCFAVLLISLDATVLNVALPTLVQSLHPSEGGLQWIADSFVLSEAVLLLMCGALGDRYGRRLMYLLGVTVFGIGSAVCALAPTTIVLIAGRVVTGVGAAILLPSTLSLVAATFPAWERPRAIGIWAGVSGIGTAAGPLLGGWLLSHFWWGSVFTINLPIVALALAGGFIFLGESRSDTKPPVDPIGVALSALGLAGITYALIVAPDSGWTSAMVLSSLGAGLALLVSFGIWGVRREDPLVDFALFKNRTFSTALFAVTAAFFSLFGIIFLLSQYIQFVQRVDVFGVGLRFLPNAVGILIGANSAPRLANRFGARAVIVVGMTLVAVALGIYATIGVTQSATPVLTAFSLVGLGTGWIIAPASNAMIGSLPPGKVGIGSAMRSTVQLLAASFAVAIIGNIAISRYRSEIGHSLRDTLPGLPPSTRSAITNQIGDAATTASHLPAGVAAKVTAAADSAFVSGLRLAAAVGLVIIVISAAAAARYIPSSKPKG